MRIALVAPLVTPIAEPHLGGSQALLSDLAQGLAARRHNVAVFAASGSRIDGVHVVDTGIDPATLQSALFRADGESAEDRVVAYAFARTYEMVARGSFDVVHNHAFDEPALETAPRDVPVVHTLHLPPRASIANALARERSMSRSVTVAAVSRSSAAAWQQITEIDVVLRNGVPVDRIPYSPAAGSGVLFAGRLSPEKGAAEALEIAHRAGVRITVVGDAYDERYAAERIERWRNTDGVELIGAVPRRKLWRLMGESAAVLCPVQWDEPFGLVAAEAQACGTPVIAFARGALGEVIRDGETGALVTDVDEAVDAVRDVATYDRGACRTHAERTLSLKDTLDAHEALYFRMSPVGIERAR